MKSNRVRFAPNCQVIVVLDRTKGIEDQLWYSGDEVDHFKLYSTLYADEVKESLSDGTSVAISMRSSDSRNVSSKRVIMADEDCS